MRLNIQTKLFLLLFGLTALIVSGVLLVTSDTVSKTVEKKIIADFNNTNAFFAKQQNLIYDRLVESCYLIGENSTFKANVELADPNSVYFSVTEFANFANADLFIVTDKLGRVLAKYGQPDLYGYDITDRPSVMRALNGIEPDFQSNAAELWEMDGNLYQVASVPLYFAQRLIGTISLGAQITRHEAEDLKGESNIDITFFLGDSIIGSTLGEAETATGSGSLLAFIGTHRPVVDAVLGSLEASPAFSSALNDEAVYAFISPLGFGAPAYYLATVNQEKELQIIDELTRNIFLTAIISVIITILLALILGRTFSKPILNLVAAMNRVKAGDWDTALKPSTRDEIGLLTQTFNQMTVGLRERFHLMRYVGSHTMEMIRKSTGSEASLGGARKELAVLFSDIRGFTAYSENRAPEAVIKMVNRYLGFQAETVDLYGGSVDKFVGDEMVALFSGEDAIVRAVDCAVAIQKLMRKEHETDANPINIGIGVNYGPMFLGNMGATQRMDYTVIGASVNLAARLCSAAQPGQILMPAQLLRLLNGSYQTASAHKMSFKGFSSEIEIVEVISDRQTIYSQSD